MNRKELLIHEDKILKGLVDFYYESGYTSKAYSCPSTGGIYEHKLAGKLGYELASHEPPPEFIQAAIMLESKGFVRRNKRKEDFDILGIWPTPQGLDHYDYITSKLHAKAIKYFISNWPQFVVPAIITVLTAMTIEICKAFLLR